MSNASVPCKLPPSMIDSSAYRYQVHGFQRQTRRLILQHFGKYYPFVMQNIAPWNSLDRHNPIDSALNRIWEKIKWINSFIGSCSSKQTYFLPKLPKNLTCECSTSTNGMENCQMINEIKLHRTEWHTCCTQTSSVPCDIVGKDDGSHAGLPRTTFPH